MKDTTGTSSPSPDPWCQSCTPTVDKGDVRAWDTSRVPYACPGHRSLVMVPVRIPDRLAAEPVVRDVGRVIRSIEDALRLGAGSVWEALHELTGADDFGLDYLEHPR
jgi:hypothetical protein